MRARRGPALACASRDRSPPRGCVAALPAELERRGSRLHPVVVGAIDWMSIVEPLDEAHGYQAFMDSLDAIVVGRGTYDVVLGFAEWSYAGKRFVVLTHRSFEPRHGEEFFAGTPAEVVGLLGSAKRVYVDGGNVIGQFLAAGLTT